MPISATSHSFAAGDIDYINNLNLVRADVGTLITDANTNPKGTMASQNANSVAITGGTVGGLTSLGIKTTSPIEEVDINGGTGDGSAYDSVLALTRTSSTGNKLAGKLVLDDKNTNYGNIVLRVKTTVSGAENASYYTDALCVDGQFGYVGIGTTPTVNLHVMRTGAGDCNAIFKADTDGAEIFVDAKNNYASYRTRINGVNKWGIGHVGSANDLYFYDYVAGSVRVAVTDAGNMLVGTTTDNGSDKLQVNGGASSTGRIVSTSSSAGVGYATGAGGTVTQTTSITTAVTLNAVCGKIALFNHVFTAGTKVQFTLNNSTLGADDILVLNGSSGPIRILAYAIGNTIVLDPLDSGSGGTNYIKFAVIKAVTA